MLGNKKALQAYLYYARKWSVLAERHDPFVKKFQNCVSTDKCVKADVSRNKLWTVESTEDIAEFVIQIPVGRGAEKDKMAIKSDS